MKSKQKTIIFLLYFIFLLLNIDLCKSTTKRNSDIKNYFSKKNIRLLDDSSTQDEEGDLDNDNSIEILSTDIIINPVTVPTSTPSTTISGGGSNSTEPVFYKSSSSGLSTGAICAIAIPCIAGLLGVAAAAALFKGGAVAAPAIAAPSLPAPNFIDTSLAKFNVVQEIPTQPVEMIQPEPIQPQPFQPQPIQQVIRPQYPINKPEPPLVNKAFQPMLNQQIVVPQQQMVPIQQVEMVPVQQVEMVPVQEVVPQAVPVQQVVPQAVPVQQVVPMQQMFPIQQGVEVSPQLTQASEIIPEVQQIGANYISQPQIINQGVEQIGQDLSGQIIQNNNLGQYNLDLNNLI